MPVLSVDCLRLCVLLFAGQEKPIEVLEPELPPDDKEDSTDEAMTEEQPQASEEIESPPLIKMKLFTGKAAVGLRIRSAPSLTVSPTFLSS